MRKTIVMIVAMLLCGLCVQAQSATKTCPFSGKAHTNATAEKVASTDKKSCKHAHQAEAQGVKAKACPQEGTASYANYKAEGKNCPHAKNATYANFKAEGKSCPHAAAKAARTEGSQAIPVAAKKTDLEAVPASF